MKKLSLLFIISLVFTCCKKEQDQNVSFDCSDLKQGMISNNADKVGAVVNGLIVQFSSQEYNNQNFDLLLNELSGQCGVLVVSKCFECVFSLPSRSTLVLATDSTNWGVQKKIDISYTSNNKMEFYDMFD